MAGHTPLFSAVSSSARQLLALLRCISFTQKALVRISAEGLRLSTEEGSTMEAFVFLEKALFTSYTYNALPPPSSQDDPPDPPSFQINLTSLLETLNIFALSDPAAAKRPGGGGYDDFAAHRLNRHAGINTFGTHALGVTGICTFSYEGPGSPLSIHMSESGVTTTCDLTTYQASTTDEIPFARDALSLKTIMRASHLLDAVAELNSMTPSSLTLLASPTSRTAPNLSLSASGALGSATVDFTTLTSSETPVLETFHCPTKTSASFRFGAIKAAQRAMGAASKVSVRLDEEGVLSLQFLVEIESASGVGPGVGSGNAGEAVAFVDFRMLPLIEGEGEGDVREGSESDSE